MPAEAQISEFNRLNFAEGLGGNVAALNQFYASVTLPTFLASLFPESEQFKRKISFTMQAANVPESTVAVMPVPFRGGAKLNLPGDRDNAVTWNATVRADVDTIVRDVFERWSDAIVGHVNHDSIGDSDLDVLSLMGVGEIHQLSRNAKVLKSYYFDLIWPTVLGGIEYSWEADSTFVTFPVTFSMVHAESNTTRNNVASEDARLSGEILF